MTLSSNQVCQTPSCDLHPLADQNTNAEDLNVSWDDVILDQDTKEVIQSLVPSSKLEVEASSDLLLSQLRIRGCLLYGPPGTGKTHLCRAIASASGSRMLSIDYATVQSSLVGRAEKYIHAAFALAAKLHPCVLFIDEADALFYRRSSSERSWERSATTQFLVEMEGLAQDPKSPLVVVATNRPWDLDEAFLRRLPQKFSIGLPDTAARAAILRLFLKQGDLDPSVDVDGIAAVTKGFSGSDLRSLCAEAALLWKMEQVRLDALCGAVSPALATSRGGPKRLRLDTDHFAAAFEKMQPNKARDNADQLERFTRRYNPVQGELGRGNGGKRYIFNEDRGRNDAFSVRELISRDPPPGEESPANMQLVVWRSAEEVLFPGRVSAQAGEAASPPQTTAGAETKASEECGATPNDDEQPGDGEDDLAEPRAQSVELVPSSEVDAEKSQSTLDHQDPHTPDTPSAPCEVRDESEGPQFTGADLPSMAPSAPEAQKTISGADVDLMPLLVTLASVLWYA